MYQCRTCSKILYGTPPEVLLCADCDGKIKAEIEQLQAIVKDRNEAIAVFQDVVERLQADNADLRIALRVHSGKTLRSLTELQQESITRGLTLCEAAEAGGESCPWCGGTDFMPMSGEAGEHYSRCNKCKNFVPIEAAEAGGEDDG